MDTRLRAYFHNSAGIFAFPRRILGQSQDRARLEHSSRIARYQRRKYYRKKERLPIFIKPVDSAAPPRASMLFDLGGGGGSLRNPEGQFGKGELLELSFSPETGSKFELRARVLRASRNGRALQVKFESLHETERDRIMGLLVKQSELRGRRP